VCLTEYRFFRFKIFYFDIEVLKSVNVKITISRNVMSCSLIDLYQCLEEPVSPSSEKALRPERWIQHIPRNINNDLKAARCHIPEDSVLQNK
jgi:hypothetical protein